MVSVMSSISEQLLTSRSSFSRTFLGSLIPPYMPPDYQLSLGDIHTFSQNVNLLPLAIPSFQGISERA
jgi:hypothetical protein